MLLPTYFQVSPKMFDRVQDWATQGHSETCPEATPVLSWLCAYGCCPVLGEPSPQSKVLSALEQVFISLYFALFIFPSILTSLPVPTAE